MQSELDLDLEVHTLSGSDIRRVCAEMCLLADRIGVNITSSFNGVHLVAQPWADPQKMVARYHEEIKSDELIQQVIGKTDMSIRLQRGTGTIEEQKERASEDSCA